MDFFFVPFNFFLKEVEKLFLIELRISCFLILQLIIFFEIIRPFCRSPKFIVGILNVGVSMIPLDELPITKSKYLRQLT